MEKGLYKTKLAITAILIIGGLSLGVYFTDEPSREGNNVITIDFGDYDIRTGIANEDMNASEALFSMCSSLGYPITYSTDGSVKTIDGQPSSEDGRSWKLFTFDLEKSKWAQYSKDPSSLNLSECNGVSWGLCNGDDVPTTIVDSTGHSFFTTEKAQRIVCLAPSVTETVCALGYEDLIIGADRYSNYPISIEQKRNAGIIVETGSYTSPDFETIAKLKPDLVIGISSQYNHIKVCEKLRNIGINAVVVKDGEDLKTVYDNTYITAAAMGRADEGTILTQKLETEVMLTDSIVSSTINRPSVMTALSADKSPWVAGNNTYISDIYTKAGSTNVFPDVDGWRQIGSETIAKDNPSVILVIGSTAATQSNYDYMLSILSEEWQFTDAYKHGEIYLICESAADMMSRPSTRLAQVTELMGRILHPEAFSDSIVIPKFIGNEYTDYLTYSKTL